MNYTVIETAKILGYTVRTIRYFLANGELKAEKDEKNYRWLISAAEIERFKAEKTLTRKRKSGIMKEQ